MAFLKLVTGLFKTALMLMLLLVVSALVFGGHAAFYITLITSVVWFMVCLHKLLPEKLVERIRQENEYSCRNENDATEVDMYGELYCTHYDITKRLPK